MKKGGMKVNEKRGGKNSTKILEDAINWGRGTFFGVWENTKQRGNEGEDFLGQGSNQERNQGGRTFFGGGFWGCCARMRRNRGWFGRKFTPHSAVLLLLPRALFSIQLRPFPSNHHSTKPPAGGYMPSLWTHLRSDYVHSFQSKF